MIAVLQEKGLLNTITPVLFVVGRLEAYYEKKKTIYDTDRLYPCIYASGSNRDYV